MSQFECFSRLIESHLCGEIFYLNIFIILNIFNSFSLSSFDQGILFSVNYCLRSIKFILLSRFNFRFCTVSVTVPNLFHYFHVEFSKIIVDSYLVNIYCKKSWFTQLQYKLTFEICWVIFKKFGLKIWKRNETVTETVHYPKNYSFDLINFYKTASNSIFRFHFSEKLTQIDIIFIQQTSDSK